MKLLLHTCCAPCLIGVLGGDYLTAEVSCFWFNPNIHPYTEYKSRLNALEIFARENNIDLIIKDYYGLREFISKITSFYNRCGFCYDWRIRECALFASQNNFDAFSSTLLISPYQNHEKIKELGEKYAELYNIKFFYKDSRGSFRAGQKKARENNIYMQKYCGCIFSEEERYLHLRKG